MEALEFVPRTRDEVELRVVALANGLDFFVGLTLQLFEVSGFRPFFLGGGNVVFEYLKTLVDLEFEFFLDDVTLFEILGLEVLEGFVTAILIDPADQMRCEVDDLLEHLRLELFLRLNPREEIREP